MRTLTLMLIAFPFLAWGDIAPDPATLPSAACVGRQEGATCGVGGTCVKRTVSRPDFTNGTPPRWIKVDVMVCVEPSRSYVIPVALVLALLLFLGRRSRDRQRHVLWATTASRSK